MMNARVSLAVAAVAALSILGGCGKGSSVGSTTTKHTYVETSSPKTVALSWHEAVAARDDAAILQCVAPGYRKSFSNLLGSLSDYYEWYNRLADAVETKLGDKAHADLLRKEASGFYPMLMPSPLLGAFEKGKVNWKRVAVNNEGGLAMIEVDGKIGPFGDRYYIRNVADGWYIAPNEEERVFDADAKNKAQGLKLFVKNLKRMEKDVRKGKIDWPQVQQELKPQG